MCQKSLLFYSKVSSISVTDNARLFTYSDVLFVTYYWHQTFCVHDWIGKRKTYRKHKVIKFNISWRNDIHVSLATKPSIFLKYFMKFYFCSYIRQSDNKLTICLVRTTFRILFIEAFTGYKQKFLWVKVFKNAIHIIRKRGLIITLFPSY